jgi:hypothetical protein
MTQWNHDSIHHIFMTTSLRYHHGNNIIILSWQRHHFVMITQQRDHGIKTLQVYHDNMITSWWYDNVDNAIICSTPSWYQIITLPSLLLKTLYNVRKGLVPFLKYSSVEYQARRRPKRFTGPAAPKWYGSLRLRLHIVDCHMPMYLHNFIYILCYVFQFLILQCNFQAIFP